MLFYSKEILYFFRNFSNFFDMSSSSSSRPTTPEHHDVKDPIPIIDLGDSSSDNDDAEDVTLIGRDSAILAASAVHGDYLVQETSCKKSWGESGFLQGTNPLRHVYGDQHVPLREKDVTTTELDNLLKRVDDLTLAVVGNDNDIIFKAMTDILHWRGDHQNKTPSGTEKKGKCDQEEEENQNDSTPELIQVVERSEEQREIVVLKERRGTRYLDDAFFKV
ncbi:GPI ethanolamine phosphate transferase 3 [Folsomia candida]|uniref:GPI ethanolamine phosphate transferase 3 n=1 Tax=Folsomia candida TaxID=158441 RepID=A0A226CXD0_FOLCA|nr:GPI ethanolamine phosphate transferase 3 [Folsomia candida]